MSRSKIKEYRDVESQDELEQPIIYAPALIYGTVDQIYSEGIYLKYFWKILLLIGGFYLLPSLQFVYFQSNDSEVDCYYNFKCKHDLGVVPAFNNIISNIVYVVAGLTFLLIVFLTRNRYDDGVHGLHNDMSLYYSLGIVLCFEGIFSGIYHVCPSRLNFQFDTTFMMIGVALLFIAVFQKRHASRVIGAPRFYAFLAYLITLNSMTLLRGTISYFVWVAVFLTLFYVMMAGSVHIYFHKRWNLDRGLPERIYHKVVALFKWEINDKSRFIALAIANIATFSVAIAGTQSATQFSDYILSVFMVNILWYIFYYVAMKVRYKEPFSKWIYLIFISAAAFLATAIHYFNIAVTDKLLTPEESRELNEPCVVFDYFDAHDVWHFLSAIGIFLLMMLLYVLDWGLESYPRAEIRVF